MAYKVFALNDEHQVTIYKRKAARNLKLTIDAKGMIKISIPAWAPYKAGIEFAKSKQAWIMANHQASSLLTEGKAIGKAHHLHFVNRPGVSSPVSRISSGSVTITCPSGINSSDPLVQQVAQKACVRALRKQAEVLLPQRLEALAQKYGYTYKSILIKNLKGRWGSCDHNKNIVLSLYLMQMPWDLIDYVIMHELTHTEVLQHGPLFWQAMEKYLPGSKKLRSAIREYQPAVR
jgi:predicted metal-dependent hydrolase